MFPTPDKIDLIKPNGERITDIAALVQPKIIFIQDGKLPIEEGDIIERQLPNDLVEKYNVLDRGFFSFPSPHYQVKVQKVSTSSLQKQVSNIAIPKKHSSTNIENSQINRKIFIVHGHNEELKNEVEGFLQSIELEPIILHKQADLGKTIIEKVEHYSDVGFAVIVLTKDDFGGALPNGQATPSDLLLLKYLNNPDQIRSVSEKEQDLLKDQFIDWLKEFFFLIKPRARQNVIFEFGYFIGKLGRNKVAALCEEDIEIPSDIDGLLYTPLDKLGAWKKKLAREIDAAEIKIDENFL